MSECNPRKTRSYQLQWDEWGMPIISSTTMSGLCQGWGFAQTFLNPNLLLLAYLRGQGRSAEYVGAHSDFGASNLTKQPDGVDFLQSDVLVRSLQIPQLADEAWSNQDDEVKDCITANGNKTAQGIIDSLIDLGDDWMSGLMNDDDITLVVIKKK